MERNWKTLAIRSAAALGALIGAMALALLFLMETAPGNAAIAWLVTPLTGGNVAIRDLSGSLPDRISVGSIELRDAKGAWLRIENVRLDWHALSLLDNHIDIATARAKRVIMIRQQEPDESPSSDLRIDISDFAVERMEALPAAFGKKSILTASGSLHYSSLRDLSANIAATRLDGDGRYRIDAAIRNGIVTGTATIAETGNGIAGGLAGLPDIGPVSLHARAAGNAIVFDLQAGDLTAAGHGTIDLGRRAANMEFSASAPAMHPRSDLSWASLTASGTMHDSLDQPQIAATLAIENFSAMGYSASKFDAELKGSNGTAELAGTADGLRIPGKEPDLFAADPMRVAASANLEAKTLPVSFTLDHPLLKIEGKANARGALNSTMSIRAPSLAPFAALGGIELAGSGTFTVKAVENPAATTVTITGAIDTNGDSMPARLMGHHATLDLSASLHGGKIISSQGALAGIAIAAQMAGKTQSDVLDYRWSTSVSDVSRIASTLAGTLDLRGTLSGAAPNAKLAAAGEGFIGSGRFEKEKLILALDAEGLPNPKSGIFHIGGRFEGAPLSIRGNLAQAGASALSATLEEGEWKSVHARADMLFPAGNAPQQGNISLHIGHLADLANLLRTKLDGSLDAEVEVQAQAGRTMSKLHAQALGLQFDAIRSSRVDVAGTIGDPLGAPVLNVTLAAAGLRAQDFSGKADARIEGPLENLIIHSTAEASTQAGETISINLAAAANTQKSEIVLQQLNGVWRDRKLSLDAPATLDYADGLAITRLSARLDNAHIDLAGRISPTLALHASVSGVTPDMLQPLVAKGTLDGTIGAVADLTGTPQAPRGTFELHARGLRVRGSSQFAAAILDARGTLKDSGIALDANLAGGKFLRLVAAGNLPLQSGQTLGLRVNGTADLGIFGAFLAASGQSLTGLLAVDTAITGTLDQPRATGTLNLSGGEFRDYPHGIRLREINAAANAQGSVIAITRMSARADQGTITGSGTIDLAAPGIPVNIAFVARDARPLVSDRITAILDSDLRLEGHLKERVTLSGSIRISQSEINIPDKLPPSVAVLNIRRKGTPAPALSAPQSSMALDLNISASNRVFVRGRGLDAELGGSLKITGTTGDPDVIGALDMRRGTLTIAGRTLEIRSGKVSFDGSSLRSRLDPTLDFTAETISGGVTATLKILGYVSAPRIQLSSSPALPQDEILAHLLFQQSVKQLSPLQLAEMAQALASLSGVGTGFDPVAMLRKSLGLDRLAVGSIQGADSGTSSTTIEAGRYVTHNVYVGAKQELSGGTHAIVEVDIAKNLKAQATVSTAGRAAATTGSSSAENGDSVGLSYQFEY